MIISASRRTDLPAYYADWFMNRIRAGWCAVPNPFNPKQVSRVGLRPEEVSAFVFWTRDPRPMLPLLAELDQRGYKYYFQVTLVPYPKSIHTNGPAPNEIIQTLHQLANGIGPQRIVWRYDPIIITDSVTERYHKQQFPRLAQQLKGAVRHCVFSQFEGYQKALARMSTLGVCNPKSPQYASAVEAIAKSASLLDIPLKWCCPPEGTTLPYDVRQGACIDPEILKEMGVPHSNGTDKGQRPNCGCVPSREIGMYESCRHGCAYCYATTNFNTAHQNWSEHNSLAPSMLGNHIPAQGNLLDL